MVNALTEAQAAAIWEILVWHKPHSRDERLWDRGVATATLLELEELGVTQRWVRGDEGAGETPRIFWTLTPWGADRLGVRMVVIGARERSRWGREAGLEPPGEVWPAGCAALTSWNRLPTEPRFAECVQHGDSGEMIDPELIVAKPEEPKEEFLLDEESGKPFTLFAVVDPETGKVLDGGVKIRIDPKLKPAAKPMGIARARKRQER